MYGWHTREINNDIARKPRNATLVWMDAWRLRICLYLLNKYLYSLSAGEERWLVERTIRYFEEMLALIGNEN